MYLYQCIVLNTSKPLHIQYMHYLVHTIRYILQTKQACDVYNIIINACATVYVANGLLCVHGYTLVQVYSQSLFCRK